MADDWLFIVDGGLCRTRDQIGKILPASGRSRSFNLKDPGPDRKDSFQAQDWQCHRQWENLCFFFLISDFSFLTSFLHLNFRRICPRRCLSVPHFRCFIREVAQIHLFLPPAQLCKCSSRPERVGLLWIPKTRAGIRLFLRPKIPKEPKEGRCFGIPWKRDGDRGYFHLDWTRGNS